MALRPDIESFYHLPGVDLRQAACRGLACFVSRHLDPQTWSVAVSQQARVYCLGKCFAAPSTGADETRPRCTSDVRNPIILERLLGGGTRSLDDYRRAGGYTSLQEALRRSSDEIIREVEASGLRGRGGAGFPTGRKWRQACGRPTGLKYVVANADEGDPGAYIDRALLSDDPHSVIEGMAIAAYAVGAARGWIYLRCEYPDVVPSLQGALEECRGAGVLGRKVLGSEFSFDVELHVGRGSYVCGEETALLNSLEGRRPVARTRPPYTAERGLFGYPTVVNNVETLASIPWIVAHGGDAYRAFGFSNSRGTKVVSLNSLFNRPGLYEVEFGIPVRRIVEDLGGGLRSGSLRGLIIGGPLAGVIPPGLLDTPLGFEELHAISASVGHGGVVAFDEHTSIPQLIHHVLSFAAYESCGECTPCRLGCPRGEQIFDGVLRTGRAPAAEREEFGDIVTALRLGSLCGLGGGVAEFLQSVSRHYGEELRRCFA